MTRDDTLPKPVYQFAYGFKNITVPTQRVDVKILVWIDLAVTDLRMRENAFSYRYFINISIYLSVLL